MYYYECWEEFRYNGINVVQVFNKSDKHLFKFITLFFNKINSNGGFRCRYILSYDLMSNVFVIYNVQETM